MRTLRLKIFFILSSLLILNTSQANAQTTLSAGDIAFVEYNADGTENFKFVTFVAIESGTQINFTDNAWLSSGAFRTGEGTLSWTSTQEYVCGDVIAATYPGGLSGSGDQLIAYQGSSTSPTVITALNNEGSSWQTASGNLNTNQSTLPSGLTDGTNAVALSEIDNAKYNGTLLTGTIDQIRTSINTASNWSGSNSAAQTFSETFSLSDCPSASTAEMDYYNLQWPAGGTIDVGSSFDVFAQGYEAGVTEAAGAGTGVECWIGYSTTDATTAADFDGSGWTWVAASFSSQQVNNDEFSLDLGSSISSPGTYYYVSRWSLDGGPYTYGGTSSGSTGSGGGNAWDGSTNASGVLTVNDRTMDYANLQSPENGSITVGGAFDVYAQGYEPGVTEASGAGTGVQCWIGYSTTDATTTADFASGWTWVAASFGSQQVNNDEFVADIGTGLSSTGTYYYVSRWQLGLGSYTYGGYNGGAWDGSTNVSGQLTVSTATIAACSELFISEYVEGSSSNKYIEIFNPTSSAVDLTGYVVSNYSGGSSTATGSMPLAGNTINAYSTVVLASQYGSIYTGSSIVDTGGATFYNGDDAVALSYNGVNIDVIGQIGFDPGSNWGGVTANRTLVRKSTIESGDNDGSDVFDPTVEWDVYAQDSVDGLGSHTSTCTPIIPILTFTSGTGLSSLDYQEGSGPSAEGSVTLTLSDGDGTAVDITAPTGFSISTTSGSGYGSSLTDVLSSATSGSVVIYAIQNSGNTLGSYSGDATASGAGASSITQPLSGNVFPAFCATSTVSLPYDSIDGTAALTHTSSSSPTDYESACGTNYRLSYTDAPSTDGSGNFFQGATATGIESSDFGGTATFETYPIDVSTATSVDITTEGTVFDLEIFNTYPAEYLEWWYTLDGGSQTVIGSRYDNNNYPTDFNNTLNNLDVSSASSLVVGFTFNINGGSDGFRSMNVNVVETPATMDYYNLQWPANGTIDVGSSFDVFAQGYEPGVTEAAGAGTGVECWIGYSTTDATTAADFDGSGWTWVAASFSSQQVNNDEFSLDLGSSISSPGTYYYVSRWSLDGGPYTYGGTSSGSTGSGGGNAWDGSTNASGVLTVNDRTMDYANLQSPENGSITVGGAFDVYAQGYEPGVTEASGAGTGVQCWIGYSTTDATTTADFASGWTWVAASFGSQQVNNDEFVADIGTPISTIGTYYYVSRWQLGLGSYTYGGYNGGAWDGSTNVSGQLTVNAIVPTLAFTSASGLTSLDYQEGSGPSAEGSVLLSLSDGDGSAVDVTAPTGFSVSTTSGSGYASSVTDVFSSGTSGSVTLYVIQNSGASAGSYSGDLTASGAGATSVTEVISGTVTAVPTIAFSSASGLTSLDYQEGSGPSAEGSVLLSLSDGDGSAVDVTAPTGFSVSTTSGSGYASSVTDVFSSGTSGSVTLYVIQNSGASAGSYSGDLTASGAGATSVTEAISGTVTAAPTLAFSSASGLTSLDYQEGSGPSAEGSVLLSLSDGDGSAVDVTAPTGFSVSTTSGSGYASSVTDVFSSGTSGSVTLYVIQNSGASAGSYSGDLTASGAGATSVTEAISGTVTAVPTACASGSTYITESFDNSSATGSYGNGTFTGDDGYSISYTASRNESTYGINGSGIMLRRAFDTSNVVFTTDKGIGDFTCSLKKAFSSSGNRQVELFVNGVSQGTSVAFDNTSVQTFTVSGINVAGNVVVEIRNIKSKQVIVDDVTYTCFSPSTATMDYYNLQWPANGTIDVGSSFDVFAQGYEPGVTEAAGAGTGVECWIGYSTTDATTAADFDGSGWTWVAASFSSQQVNNDEFSLDLGSSISSPGTYYYVSRWSLDGGPYTYGGTSSGSTGSGGGNAWDGSTNASGVLTVNDRTMDYANLQSPENGSITVGGAFDVYAQGYEPGVTEASGAGTGVQCWIGYSTTDATTTADFASGWTWVAASFGSQQVNNDEFVADIGTGLSSTGTYYYVSRWQLGLGSYTYGGYNGGAWDGSTNVSGQLTVSTATIAACSELFISEYVEGSSSNKYIEIFNPTSSAVDLTGYVVSNYSGGSSTATSSMDLSGNTINAYSTVVLANSSASIYTGSVITDAGGTYFNGDDAVALSYNGVNIDVIGQIGFDPGSNWGGVTANRTLVRKSTIESGDNDGSDVFDPTVEWDVYAQDSVDGLGSHTSTCTPIIPILTFTSGTGLSSLDYQEGSGPSAEGSVTLTLSDGDGTAVDITAPTGFSISTTSGSGYGSSLTDVLSSATSGSVVIYAIQNSGNTLGSYSGDATASGAGASSITQPLSGNVFPAFCATSTVSLPYDSIDGTAALTHTSSSSPTDYESACGTNYRLSYTDAPSTDGSGNFFQGATATGIESSDFGGTATFETYPIDVSTATSVDITTEGTVFDLEIFNTYPAEYLEWWYTLDGGSQTVIGSRYDNNNYPTDFNNTLNNLDVSSASSLVVGFTFNINGGSDGFRSMNVNVVETPSSDFTWSGGTSSDWGLDANWSNGTAPSAATDVVIVPSATNDPSISVTQAVGDLTVADNVTVSISSGASLEVNGDASLGSGSALTGDGTVSLSGGNSGTSLSITGSATIENLVIESNYSLSSGILNITGGLTLNGGDFTGGINVILTSNTNGTAYLDDFSGSAGGTYNGQITTQLYIPGTTGIQHLISSPINNVGLSELSDDLSGYGAGLTGQNGVAVTPATPCDQFALDPSSNYGNMFEYDAPTAAASPCQDQGGWVVRSAGNMDNGRGYSAYLTGAGSTLDMSGAPNTGAIDIQMNAITTFTGTATSYNGWDMLGNPYPSSLDRNAVINGNTGSGLSSLSYWNPSGTYSGSYQPYQFGDIIASFQGFAAKSENAGSTPTVSFGNSMRTTADATWRSVWYNERIDVELRGNGFADRTIIVFADDATNGFDAMYDAEKFASASGQPTLYTGSTEHYALNSLAADAYGQSIPMGMIAGADGYFEFDFSTVENLPNGSMLYLEDLATGTWTNVSENPVYGFNMLATDASDRFILHFTPEVTATAVDGTCENADAYIELTFDGYQIAGQDVAWNYAVSKEGMAQAQGSMVSTIAIPVNESGIYNVDFTFGNAAVSEVLSINVPVAPTAAIPAEVALSENEAITLNGMFTNANSYEWAVDGVVFSTEANPTWTASTEGIYNIAVTVRSEDGCSASDNMVAEVSKSVTSINDVNAVFQITQDAYSVVVLTDAEGFMIEMIAMDGKLVASARASQGANVLSTQALAAGVYEVRLSTANGVVGSQKVLVK